MDSLLLLALVTPRLFLVGNSELIDSMNACRMTHASHSIQLGHLLLSSCLTHRRLPVASMSELPCIATDRVYTLPPGGESRGRWCGATVNGVGLTPTTAPVRMPRAGLVRRHIRPGTPGCVDAASAGR
jgi:hypothetical protein